MDIVNDAFSEIEREKAHKAGRPYLVPHLITLSAGTEFEHPEANRTLAAMLRQGIAEPLDEEAKAVIAGMDPDLLAARYEAYLKLEKGMATGDPTYDNEPEEGEENGVERLNVDDDTPLCELGD